jgi:type II secretory pathway component GspD/PulD (secretin)
MKKPGDSHKRRDSHQGLQSPRFTGDNFMKKNIREIRKLVHLVIVTKGVTVTKWCVESKKQFLRLGSTSLTTSRLRMTNIFLGIRALKIVAVTVFVTVTIFNPLILRYQAVTAYAELEKTITLDVKEMEITDVLRMISDQSGLNIIASKNVKGLVAINLQNIPVEKALDAILKVNNCGYVKEGGIIQVYTNPELTQREQLLKSATRVFHLNYVKAADLKQALTSLKSAKGTVEVEPKTNSVVVTDTVEYVRSIEEAIKEMDKKLETKIYRLNYAKPADLQKTLLGIIPAAEGDVLIDDRTNSLVVTASPVVLSKMDTLISNWDKQAPQVLIEAKIMQITLEKNKFIGIDWQYQNPDKHTITVGAKNLPIPTGVPYVDAFKIGVLGVDDYQVAIHALENSSDVNLISSPQIVTLDNKEARILIGSSEPYEIFHFDERGIINGKEIKFVEVGIKLTVIPKITDNGFITMNIHPEVSSPRKGTVTDALAVDTTEANTVMTVKDGNTVVLGGLIKDDNEKHLAKVPLLGDIPLIKYFFRNYYNTKTKKEIVIFITPKIINPDKIALTSKELSLEKKEEEMRKAMDNLYDSKGEIGDSHKKRDSHQF